MAVRKAEAKWEGSLLEGNGKMWFGSGAFEGRYSFASRFADGPGTSPEELLASAHAGCFSMALTGIMEQAGFHPESVQTRARVHIEPDGPFAFKITRVELETEVRVPGITEAAFQETTELARTNCALSHVIGGNAEIILKATLLN